MLKVNNIYYVTIRAGTLRDRIFFQQPKGYSMRPFFTRLRTLQIHFFLCISLVFTVVSAAETDYQLTVRFDPERHTLQGEAHIHFPAGKKWQLFTGNLLLQSLSIREEGKEGVPLPLPAGNTISMYASPLKQTVNIRYSLQVLATDPDNRIDRDGIFLTSAWHPLPDRNMRFSLSASLPSGFTGISESDTVPQQDDSTLSTSFSQPVQSIHLAAAPYQVEQIQIRDGLTLSTLFFAEDRDLSSGYLDAAKKYILRYESEIAPFPYSHYAVVANRLPSGFGMPTFTLLGQAVLRLPFIKQTSLGHEILHSWFGNSIEVAAGSGNWCEGLTTYLADYRFEEEKGQGAQKRKAALVKYQNTVHADTAISLQDFHSASHNQAMAKAARAVGYTRGAMLFHQLRGIIGPEYFAQGIRLLAAGFRGRAASWEDIQQVFSTASGKNLQTFFSEQLSRTDIPQLQLSTISVESTQDSSSVRFTVEQMGDAPYTLLLPIRVTGMDGTTTFTRPLTEKKTELSLPLSSPPLSISLDPDYDIFRGLQPDETAAVWSSFLGAEHRLVIRDSDGDNDVFAPLVRHLTKEGLTITDSKSISNKQLAENTILFLGSNSTACRSLFGAPQALSPGFHLQVQKNPLNEQETVTRMESSSAVETLAVVSRLSHYGKYSTLSFHNGRLQKKTISPTDAGQRYVLETLPEGASTKTVDSFQKIVAELAKKRVIYLGESHTSLPDHLLQLRIIQALRQRGLDLAVAMEMFPATSQQALDDYVLQQTDMDESAFLRASRWFNVWRYDWRLFRPLFNFCRAQAVPVFGINVEKEIVSKVFSTGNTDELSQEQLQTIAPDRDLMMEGYLERLRVVHGFHSATPHGKMNSLAGFVQSQAIWDESMAANIHKLLEKYPNKTLVVIAGSQHTRKDSGIPPRLLRRMKVEQASVLNISSDQPPADLKKQVDYFFLAEEQYLEAKGKIGVILKPEEDGGRKQIRITGISDSGKAAQAGILKDDILTSIGGQAVTTMNDIGIIMMDSRAGDRLQVTVSRKNAAGEQEEKELTVELSDLSNAPVKP